MSSKTLAEAQNIRDEIETKLKNIISPYRLNLIRRLAQKQFNDEMQERCAYAKRIKVSKTVLPPPSPLPSLPQATSSVKVVESVVESEISKNFPILSALLSKPVVEKRKSKNFPFLSLVPLETLVEKKKPELPVVESEKSKNSPLLTTPSSQKMSVKQSTKLIIAALKKSPNQTKYESIYQHDFQRAAEKDKYDQIYEHLQ